MYLAGMMAHAFNPSPQDSGREISEFEASLIYKENTGQLQLYYTEKLCLEKKGKREINGILYLGAGGCGGYLLVSACLASTRT